MLIHRRDVDASVVSEVGKLEAALAPVGIASFTRVEIKGNLIQDLILLRNKILASSDFASAVSRIRNTGGRKAVLMLSQFLKFLGGSAIAPTDWSPLQSRLVTLVEGQVLAVWQELAELSAFDRTECSRAKEAPRASRSGAYTAEIPRCTKANTNCRIEEFLDEHRNDLIALENTLAQEPALTDELQRIRTAIAEVLKGVFDWSGTRCRTIGDLIIALEATAAAGLVTSNHREHSILSKGLPYKLRVFPLASVRQK